MSFHPYLMFGGNCGEAFTRYQEIFGGELVLMPMSDMPSETPVPPEQKDMIMHAALTSEAHLLMGSDDPTGFNGVQGMNITYSANDVGEAQRVFEALADRGQVSMPLAETFFSPGFGMCVDRFGTPWMIVADAPQPAS